jgi:hypothetical protein
VGALDQDLLLDPDDDAVNRALVERTVGVPIEIDGARVETIVPRIARVNKKTCIISPRIEDAPGQEMRRDDDHSFFRPSVLVNDDKSGCSEKPGGRS